MFNGNSWWQLTLLTYIAFIAFLFALLLLNWLS